MGLLQVDVELKTIEGASRTVQMLVDSGAVYSCLPRKDWQALGLRKKQRCRFDLIDGTMIERDVSECIFRYAGLEATSIVILGEDDDVALLGVLALESLGLVLDPYKGKLGPMRLLLAGAQRSGYASLVAP